MVCFKAETILVGAQGTAGTALTQCEEGLGWLKIQVTVEDLAECAVTGDDVIAGKEV